MTLLIISPLSSFTDKLLIEQFSSQLPRARRETPKSCIDQNSCCNDDVIQNYHGDDKDISAQCYRELNFNRANIRGPLTDEQKQQIKVSASNTVAMALY